MLVKIDKFTFELNKKDVSSINHDVTFQWKKQKRLGNHNYIQRDGLWEESIRLDGKLILKNVHELQKFEEMAKKQNPVNMLFGTGEKLQVVIESLNRTKSGFLETGEYRYQEYSIVMQRYFQ